MSKKENKLLVEVIKPKEGLYSFNSLRYLLVLNYKDLLLVYLKAISRYNKAKIFSLSYTKFTLLNIYLKSNKFKLIKYLLYILFIVK